MDALVMAGGPGTRLDAPVEKPLFEVGGRPMIDRVRAALEASRVDTVHVAVSPHTPATRRHLEPEDVRLIRTPGEGYVADLETALDRTGRPVLTVAADLPLLAAEPVDRLLGAYRGRSVGTHVPVALKRRLGVSVDTAFEHDGRRLAPTGLNVVADGADAVRVSYDVRLAVNVNRPADARVAEGLL